MKISSRSIEYGPRDFSETEVKYFSVRTDKNAD